MPVLLGLGWCALSVGTALAGYLAIAVPTAAAVADPILATLTVDAIVVLAVLGVRLIRPRWMSYRPEPDPMPHTPRFWAWVVLSFVLVFLAGQSAALTLHSLPGSPVFDAGIERRQFSPVGLVVLLKLVVAPMSEEAFFRGLLYPLLRRRSGALMSMVVTTLAFAFAHGNLVQAASVVSLGLLLALVYERTRTLWSAVALHVVFNLVAFLIPPTALQVLATPLCSGFFLSACALCLVNLHRRTVGHSTSDPTGNASA